MALAQDETVTLGIVGISGIDTQGAEIECGEDVGHGHVAARMPLLGAIDHSEREPSNLARLCDCQLGKWMRTRHVKPPTNYNALSEPKSVSPAPVAHGDRAANR